MVIVIVVVVDDVATAIAVRLHERLQQILKLIGARFSLLHGKDAEARRAEAVASIKHGHLPHVLVDARSTLVAWNLDVPTGLKQVRQEGTADRVEAFIFFTKDVRENGVSDQTRRLTVGVADWRTSGSEPSLGTHARRREQRRRQQERHD